MYWLTDKLLFPPVEEAEKWGGLAVGGDLSPERLLLAYRSGIFPWYDASQPIVWYAPDPRFVLFPHKLKVSRRMRPILNQECFTITYDTQFREVIRHCQQITRPGQSGTWITEEMREAYYRLHTLGHAHSVEVWQGDALVGGLYGLTVGSVFCGESMFSRANNASKVGFITLVRRLQQQGFTMIDCQVHTPHLEKWGAENISRVQYMRGLVQGLSGRDYWKGDQNM